MADRRAALRAHRHHDQALAERAWLYAATHQSELDRCERTAAHIIMDVPAASDSGNDRGRTHQQTESFIILVLLINIRDSGRKRVCLFS